MGAYRSEYGVIIKNEEVDWINYEDCMKICGMSALKKELGYNILIYPKKFIEFIDYWNKKINC